MLFSVLMSVYAKDRPAWIREAVDSILTNTVSPAEEVIVIDGLVPSSLQTVLTELSSHHKQIELCPLAKNGGLGPALAYGLQQCSYGLVARYLPGGVMVQTADDMAYWLDVFNENPAVREALAQAARAYYAKHLTIEAKVDLLNQLIEHR